VLNKPPNNLFIADNCYVFVDADGNRSTYYLDFDPDTFASLIVEKCIQTLVNHGYTDAATVLKTEYAEDWQKLEFPKI